MCTTFYHEVVEVRSSKVVELTSVVTLLGEFPALSGLDLSVHRGEIVCIEGPNGAGKSTLLRLCAGLLSLHDGEGTVLGKRLDKRAERRELRQRAGLLAHETFLYDELTVMENLRFWCKANRSDLSTIDPVLDRLSLSGRLETVKVGNLSAGQRRRTSLAVMVVRRPHLWLLDEPHAALDRAGKDAVDSLVELAVQFGATVMLASHDQDRARSLSHRALTLSGGRVISDELIGDGQPKTVPKSEESSSEQPSAPAKTRRKSSPTKRRRSERNAKRSAVTASDVSGDRGVLAGDRVDPLSTPSPDGVPPSLVDAGAPPDQPLEVAPGGILDGDVTAPVHVLEDLSRDKSSPSVAPEPPSDGVPPSLSSAASDERLFKPPSPPMKSGFVNNGAARPFKSGDSDDADVEGVKQEGQLEELFDSTSESAGDGHYGEDR